MSKSTFYFYYYEILFTLKKWESDTWYHMDAYIVANAKWNKPATEG